MKLKMKKLVTVIEFFVFSTHSISSCARKNGFFVKFIMLMSSLLCLSFSCKNFYKQLLIAQIYQKYYKKYCVDNRLHGSIYLV